VTSRILRVNELLRREIGEALYQVVKTDDLDLSAVTVTHVVTSRNLRQARVLVSIRDHKEERNRMLDVLRRCRPRIQRMINRDLTLKYTPRLLFELDESIEKGDDMLHLLSEINIPDEETDSATEEAVT